MVPDAILDSPWARHPTLARRTERWIDYWLGPGVKEFQLYLGRMEHYREVVDREIAARGLPPSLRYLPIIERADTFRPPGARLPRSACGSS